MNQLRLVSGCECLGLGKRERCQRLTVEINDTNLVARTFATAGKCGDAVHVGEAATNDKSSATAGSASTSTTEEPCPPFAAAHG